MRVQYTIPGWEPAPAPGQSGALETQSVFETKMREASAVAPAPSAALLGLNRPMPGSLALGPPPRPASMAFSDIQEDRRKWHGLLNRHDKEPPEDPGAYQMLVLLAELQRMEDEFTAVSLVDSRD